MSSNTGYVLLLNSLAGLLEEFKDVGDMDDPISITYLKWMLDEVLNNLDTWDKGKVDRWVGYVQCALVARMPHPFFRRLMLLELRTLTRKTLTDV